MKSIIWICGFTLFVCVAYVRSEINEEAAAECAKEYSFEAKDAVKELLSSDEELTEEHKCFAKCYMQKVGYLNDDGDIEIELSFTDMYRDREVNDDTREKFEAAVTMCTEKYDKMNCDLAGHAYHCLMKELNLGE